MIAKQYVAFRRQLQKGPGEVAKKGSCELPKVKRARGQAERRSFTWHELVCEQFVASVSFTAGVEWFFVGRHCAKWGVAHDLELLVTWDICDAERCLAAGLFAKRSVAQKTKLADRWNLECKNMAVLRTAF